MTEKGTRDAGGDRSARARRDRLTADGARTSVALQEGAGPYGIAAGLDGALWFTAIGAEAIGRLHVDGAVSMIDLPGDGGMPAMITTGPGGALWFTLNQAGALGRADTDGSITLRRLPDPGCGPVGINGDESGLWFTEINAGRVGQLTTSGTSARARPAGSGGTAARRGRPA